ncbi:androglobin-like [Galleria mellonella]|uniref:Androglobin-like n=1 Tax=Galleria mellonella TaxID=7137 RepID=A0ABM3N714_GALME|nr:androglobin-like [Galleria mellonella]
MTKKADQAKSALVFEIDPTECPFREFRDNELQPEFWGLGPAACRATMLLSKTSTKSPGDHVWVDEQTQPLPRSVRRYLHGWVRAEDLAMSRWEAEAVVFEDNGGGKMSVADTQLSHSQVLLRSSFCRRMLSACFILERIDGMVVEHQWENFVFSIGPEGWRAKYHIYSPGTKPGGGTQHRPGLSKNGCYLVRLFYLGVWRCIWVSDQVPIDATGAPLLPFSPLINRTPAAKPRLKQAPITVTSSVVHMWPLLLCKALLKVAAPDMNSDEDVDCLEDEAFEEFNIMHCLTGSMNMMYHITDAEELWNLICKEVPLFSWDDDDDTLTSTVKSRNTKKPINKETAVVRRGSITTIVIEDSKNQPPYSLPGITPGHEMDLLITMARDVPLKKPLPEPEVALWKHYRWIDWARRHGLYEAYDCPRTRFLKVSSLLKSSYAPHLLDVQSTESITYCFREEHGRNTPIKKGGGKDVIRSNTGISVTQQVKDDMREWMQYSSIKELIKNINVLYHPSMYQFTSAASNPPIRITKGTANRSLDIQAPKSAPLYLQIDGPDENVLRISLNMLHPRVLFNSGVPIVDHIEPAYLILERFEWFKDCEVPMAKAFIQTRGYDSVEIKFPPGRHVCRIWVHSRMNWHLMLLSESTLLLGSRDIIQCAAVRECSWASRYLLNISTAFSNWARINKSSLNIIDANKDFYKSYQPDLIWDPQVVGYDKLFLHWMFRQALQSFLMKRLQHADFRAVCTVLRHYFHDPEFGMLQKPSPPKSLREIVDADPCDCIMPESEEIEIIDEQIEEQVLEEKPIVDAETMVKLLRAPVVPITSQVCELATKEVSCGILKDKREKAIRRHEAATILQAHWRGTWARKCLNTRVTFTPEVMKAVMDNAFGNLESLSALMNEFFGLYPGTKNAYSVASALSGVYGLHQYNGSCPVTPQCKWIPYFQGVFFCHGAVKVHFDVQSSFQYHCTMAVYNNDTGVQMPQAYNSHITFDFLPNAHGYTVTGHGTVNQPIGCNHDVHWHLTVLCSVKGAFHVCDNDIDFCKETPLPSAKKLHFEEMFIPNRRNILGGIQISVTKHEAVSFRAAATSPDLEIEAILRTKSDGIVEELGRCSGKGELYWPFISLDPTPPSSTPVKRHSTSYANLGSANRDSALLSARSLKSNKIVKASASGKNRSNTKIKTAPSEPKEYFIEVIATNGWPLTLAQWKRVGEVRDAPEICKLETPIKKTVKDKVNYKEKDKHLPAPIYQPQPGDAYTEMECSFAVNGGAYCKRDDVRDLEFAAARRAWDAKEPGRNQRGAQIRKDFWAEFLEAVPPPPSESTFSIIEEMVGEEYGDNEEEEKKYQQQNHQGPTPATESGLLEMTVETEEEAKYLVMPEQLRDKFIPLYFLPFCTKEKVEENSVVLTPDIMETAKKDRHARIEAALGRMKELQTYNELYVLGRQKKRCQLLEKLFVDSQWNPELAKVLNERDEAIARETLNRTLSATKKKQEVKKK